MKRTVETTSTRTVFVCDRCGKQGDSDCACAICKRECCFRCARLVMAYRPPEPEQCCYVDLAFRLCTDCENAKDEKGLTCVDDIRSMIAGAEMAVSGVVAKWTERVRSKREDDLIASLHR